MIVVVKRSNIALIALIACLVVMIFLLNGNPSQVVTVSTDSLAKKVVVIDAGHGGIDPGAVGPSGLKEKDVNLKIAFMVKELLEKSGATPVMTRSDDTLNYTSENGSILKKRREDLMHRKAMVLKSNADLFVSIHLNSFTQSKYSGAQVFYPKASESGRTLAQVVQTALIEKADSANKRVPMERDGIRIFDNPKVPVILVECGFLTNPDEEKRLSTEAYQRKLADAIYTGISRYLDKSTGNAPAGNTPAGNTRGEPSMSSTKLAPSASSSGIIGEQPSDVDYNSAQVAMRLVQSLDSLDFP